MGRRFLSLWLFLLLCLCARGQEPPFKAAVPSEEGFVAAGSCFARLDQEGTVLYEKPLDVPVSALCLWQGRMLALTADGEVQELDAKGDVVARLPLSAGRGGLRDLASDGELLAAVSDQGEILLSRDAQSWTVLDFNADYAGYYPRMDFRTVSAGGGSILVAGVGEDGLPYAFVSSRGTVWSVRSLEYTGRQGPLLPDSVPEGLDYDASGDCFYLSFRDGGLLTLPGCTHCNAWEQKVSGPLYACVRGAFSVLLLTDSGALAVTNM